MKNIAILSRHAVSNYGSILQAVALEKKLESLGCRAEYIDYRLKRDLPLREAYREVGLAAPVKALPKRIGAYKFERMRRKYLSQSERVWDISEVRGLCEQYDAVCVGSDQVWNVLSDGLIDATYLLTQVSDEKYKFSYASSFGRAGVADGEIGKVISALKRFNRVSVREESGKSFLETFEVSSDVCVDPVHLLTSAEWAEIVEPHRPNVVRGHFILVYNLHPSAHFDAYVSQATQYANCQVISIRPTLRRTCGHNLFFPSLEEFLWLFLNADCVLTDSFHGTAFSILFNTSFVDILPDEYSERNRSVLSRYGLTDLTTKSISPRDILNTSIDWIPINEKLSANRAESIAYLMDCIAGI